MHNITTRKAPKNETKEQNQGRKNNHVIIRDYKELIEPEIKHTQNATKSSKSQAKDLAQHKAAKPVDATNRSSVDLSKIEKDIDVTTNNSEKINRTNSTDLSRVHEFDAVLKTEKKPTLLDTPDSPVKTENNLFKEPSTNKNIFTETYSKIIESFQKIMESMKRTLNQDRNLTPSDRTYLKQWIKNNIELLRENKKYLEDIDQSLTIDPSTREQIENNIEIIKTNILVVLNSPQKGTTIHKDLTKSLKELNDPIANNLITEAQTMIAKNKLPEIEWV